MNRQIPKLRDITGRIFNTELSCYRAGDLRFVVFLSIYLRTKSMKIYQFLEDCAKTSAN